MKEQKTKFEKWVIEKSLMKHNIRKVSMFSVAKSFLLKHAKELNIKDYESLIKSVQEDAEKYETLSEKERDFCDTASTVGVWATVAACIKPYINLSEWLNLTEDQANGITDAVMEKNPHWFEIPDQEKKTDSKVTTSTSDLAT